MMSDLFPTAESIKEALLSLIHFNDGEVRPADTYVPLANYFDLSRKARTITRREHYGGTHPQLAWHNLVQYGRYALKKEACLAPDVPKGVRRLSERGKTLAASIASRYQHLRLADGPMSTQEREVVVATELGDGLNAERQASVEGQLLAIEGAMTEELSRRRMRDAELRRTRLQLDGNKCRACGFTVAQSFSLPSGAIVEVHHINPLADTDEVITSVEDLLTLCPTCHRLTHALAARFNRTERLDLDFIRTAQIGNQDLGGG